ncbi:bifunctional riboflavin kinase/FAD synthetase [Blochmannia endosymbiont of Camponotus (Colobopsis) obliquus]|uniref:bifunctional riboflavin kinase/FAD synthetase n=1 Tax=Blochmannia endosymbiont of Camponotus (Colobopsis) obliquus TaxID=1505597 RepID=UPI00061A60BB|nr:bifunctional riboflavin kinase/FAD synthetase [Blochmannia endosymbiont of Camponotus (Colobopsis) obliquus]AKC60294.1 riboflavin biosynthesis protein RibF [Blochmannia endosymbiont of Camponotus (Colobopsis) obliquus]
MEFIRGVYNLKARHRSCVLTIGNFDGFHRGHQALIEQLKLEGRNRNLPCMVMIFEPYPKEFLTGKKVRLTTLRDKLKYLADVKVDIVLCVLFDKKFAILGAYTFITQLLVKELNVRFICVGNDFRFGSNRKGDYLLLRQTGKDIGFDVMSIITYTEKGQRISSSAIRVALMQDRLTDAEMLLGHDYRISGRVTHGNALGRVIGFPTANILLKGYQFPIHGVYLVEIYGVVSGPLPGLANIGVRPTICGLHQRLEIYLLDIVIDLYGMYITVVIRKKMRNEQHFCSLEELQCQIKHDILCARSYFKL